MEEKSGKKGKKKFGLGSDHRNCFDLGCTISYNQLECCIFHIVKRLYLSADVFLQLTVVVHQLSKHKVFKISDSENK